jgi:hypothetical protein
MRKGDFPGRVLLHNGSCGICMPDLASKVFVRVLDADSAVNRFSLHFVPQDSLPPGQRYCIDYLAYKDYKNKN